MVEAAGGKGRPRGGVQGEEAANGEDTRWKRMQREDEGKGAGGAAEGGLG